jgi:hypothetical protein
MCCSLWLHVLEYFFNSPTTLPTYKAGDWVMCCSFVLFVLEYFSTVLPNSHLSRIKDVLLFCDYMCEYFFNSPTQFPPIAGLSDVLLFVIPFMC